MQELVIDAKNYSAGRLASVVAKQILNGKRVYVVNASEAVISGNPKYVIEIYIEKVRRGDPYHGPFYPKTPERILKRMVRGMLPKKARGREALKRLSVFREVPEEFKNKSIQRFEGRIQYKSITLKKLSRQLGGLKNG